MAKSLADSKSLSVRIPKDMWVFLKIHSLNIETTMAEILLDCIEKYRRKVEKKSESDSQ